MTWRIYLFVAVTSLSASAQAATVAGTVIGEGARPIAGAAVEVVQAASQTPCRSTTGSDGTFSFRCDATGRYTIRASYGELRPWEIADIELTPHGTVHLNFLLVPATTRALDDSLAIVTRQEELSFWTRPVPNPIVLRWNGIHVTLRMAAIAIAPISFILGALTMFALGRRFGIQTRRLSPNEVGDMVLNPITPTVGERVTPIAVAGARGASATVSYSADEIAIALAERRYGLVFVALVIAPGLFALFALAFALAMLIGQETYLLCAMLLVPAGFVLTPIMIARQAKQRMS